MVTDASFERLERRVDGLDNEVGALRDEQNATKLSVAVAVEGSKAVVDRIGRMESSIVWLTRTVLGAIVLAVVAFIVKGGLGGVT